MRYIPAFVFQVALVATGWGLPAAAYAQSETYELVPTWPNLPSGTFFGSRDGWPDQAARDRAAAARRALEARDQAPGLAQTQGQPQPQIFGQGVSGIAIDDQDRIYVFNRGVQTILVFDKSGELIRGGGEMDAEGQPIVGGWLHSGEVDWLGNVWVVERDNHRILKLNPTFDRVVLQLGTTGVSGNDERHFSRPSGISVLRSGRLIVTDGYGNNRVVMYSSDGTFIKQIGMGSGGPDDAGTGPGEFDLPHQAAVDASDNIFVVDRENRRIQVFDENLTYLREFSNDGWNPSVRLCGKSTSDPLPSGGLTKNSSSFSTPTVTQEETQSVNHQLAPLCQPSGALFRTAYEPRRTAVAFDQFRGVWGTSWGPRPPQGPSSDPLPCHARLGWAS